MIIVSGKDLKYYAYISESKLAMLHGQLSGNPAQRKLEWKIGGSLLSVSRSVQRNETDQTKHARLKDVLEALDQDGQIGTIEEPREYFRATLPMRWGIYNDQGRPEAEAPLVYFGAYAGTTVLGLGGSSRHVVGCEGLSSTSSRSVTPNLVGPLLRGMGMTVEGWNAFDSYDSQSLIYEAVALATSQLYGPTQPMEFVARTLLSGFFSHSV